MKRQDVIQKASKIWQQEAIPATLSSELLPDLETQKRLLKLFHVGDFYYYVFDLKRVEFPFMSPEINVILGEPENGWTIQEIVSRIHPDDMEFFINAEQEVSRFFSELPAEKVLNYKSRYDIRLRKNDGTYIRILSQIMVLESNRVENELKSFCVHTDITHLKKDLRSVLSFIGMDGEPSFIDVMVGKKQLPVFPFTKRESEILPFLANGMTSDEIGVLLNVSKHTIDTHRRKMIKQTNSRSTPEMISVCVKHGWI